MTATRWDREQLAVLARYAGLNLDPASLDALVPLLEALEERVRRTDALASRDTVPASALAPSSDPDGSNVQQRPVK